MFEIKTELYRDSVKRLPVSGQQIIGYQAANSIVVYQAYNRSIADFAVANQYLGGPAFSYNRMSWIKPNFLWMMFRCGWAQKENQEAVLAITISKDFFVEILSNAAISSYSSAYHQSHDQWKEELNRKSVRLQWDPDHDPFGNKVSRRAIQLGMKDDILERFGKIEVKEIENITPFVIDQLQLVEKRNMDDLVVPYETIFQIPDSELAKRIAIESP